MLFDSSAVIMLFVVECFGSHHTQIAMILEPKELSALFLVIRVITHSMVVVSSLFNKIPTIYSQKSHDASGSFMFKIEYFSHAQLKRSFDSFRLYYKT